jgi:hypothetical protein
MGARIARAYMETRYIYRLEPARSVPAAVFEAAFANSLQQAISGPAPAGLGRH